MFISLWIVELREHLECGELAQITSIDADHGKRDLLAGHAVRIVLADLASFDDLASVERVSTDLRLGNHDC